MIFLRLFLLGASIAVIISAASAFSYFLPCPSTQPPPGLRADFFATWSAVIFFACLVYVMIPVLSFQVWAALLGPTLALGFAIAFAQSGAWNFALFLLIQCAITIALALVFNAIATASAEVLEWPSWAFKVLALPAAYMAANGWGYVQAIGFAQSMC